MQDFLEQVCGHITSPKAREAVRRELAGHMDDLTERLEGEGLGREEAQRRAVLSMGDPEQLGKELQRRHCPRFDALTPFLALLMCAAGAAVLWCAPEWARLLAVRFGGYALMGAAVLFLLRRVDYTLLLRHPAALYLAACALPLLGLLSGRRVGGRIWVDLGFISFNPAWPMTVLFLLSVTAACARLKGKGLPGLLAAGVLCACALFTLVLLPQMAAAVILWGGFLAVLLPLAVGGHFGPQKRLLGLTASIGGLLPLAALLPGLVHAYRRGAGDPAQGGYLFALVRRTLSGAAAWGNTLVWPGEEMPPIPGGFNDFMLTLVIGRFGWIAGVLCAAAIAVFLVRMFRLSFRIRPAFGRALARGAAVLFALRFVSGLLLNLGVLPFGYAVPFFSYGGSLMICDLALLGVFLSAWRGSALMAEEGGFTGTLLYRAARWARGMLSKEGES